MNGFHDFDNFRVSAWMSEGVMIRFEEVKKEARRFAKNLMKKAVTTAAGAIIVSSTVSISATAATSPRIPASEQVFSTIGGAEARANAALEAELDMFANQMSSSLSYLESEHEFVVDSDLLTLANAAIIASDERRELSPMAIAEAFFFDGR